MVVAIQEVAGVGVAEVETIATLSRLIIEVDGAVVGVGIVASLSRCIILGVGEEEAIDSDMTVMKASRSIIALSTGQSCICSNDTIKHLLGPSLS